MEKKVKVYSGDITLTRLKEVEKLFADNGFTIVSKQAECDIIVFCGTGPLHPQMYGQWLGAQDAKFTESSVKNQYITKLYTYQGCKSKNKFCIGLEEGALFLANLSGAKIYDISLHKDVEHEIFLDGANSEWFYSEHEQVMYPYELDVNDYEVLGDCYLTNSNNYISRDRLATIKIVQNDVELCYFNKTNSLSILPSLLLSTTTAKNSIFKIINQKFDEFSNKTSRNSILRK
jgi:hypothetical protein